MFNALRLWVVFLVAALYAMKLVAIITITASYKLFFCFIRWFLAFSFHSFLYFSGYFEGMLVNFFNIISPIFSIYLLWIRGILTFRPFFLCYFSKIVLKNNLFNLKWRSISTRVLKILLFFEIRLYFQVIPKRVYFLTCLCGSNILLWRLNIFNKPYHSFGLINSLFDFLLFVF